MKLPQPNTIADHYLAAILAELVRLNATMDKLAQRTSSANEVATTREPIVKQVKSK